MSQICILYLYVQYHMIYIFVNRKITMYKQIIMDFGSYGSYPGILYL